jgi:ATP-dependent Zn protease
MALIKKEKLDFNVWKITFINVRIIISPKDYKKWAKLYLQKNFNLNNWNLKTLVHLTPFLFGFSNMIWSRYQDQTISSIFGQTIPGTKILKEDISWETFKFVRANSIDFKNIKQIDFYTNSCFLQFKTPYKERFIGIMIPKNTIDSEKETEKKVSFNFNPTLGATKTILMVLDNEILSKNLVSQLQELYYNLDEIPLKIEGLTNNNLNNKKDLNSSIFTSKLSTIFNNQIKEDKNFDYLNFKTIKPVFLPQEFLNEQETKKYPIFLNGVKVSKTKKTFQFNFDLKEKSEFLLDRKKEILKDEINFLFYNQGVKPTNENKNIQLPIFSFNDYSAIEALQILNEFINLKPLTIDPLRTFSGYQYPDLSEKNVYHLLLKNVIPGFQEDYFLKIQLPANLVTDLKDDSLVNRNFCSSLPITSRKDNFLGTNDFLKKINNNQNEDFSGINTLNWKNCISQENFKTDNKSFEDFDDFDPDSWFLSFKQQEKTKAIDFEEKFLINFLQENFKKKFFYIDNSIFQNKRLIYHFPQFTESFLPEKNTNLYKIGDLYKRTPTFTTLLNNKGLSLQKTNFYFFESWEPITLTSWMLVLQFSIGLFLLHLVKDLYKDYGKELVEYVLQFASSSGIDIEEIKEQYLYDDPGYRLIRKIKKSFKDIAGIDNILLQLGELVWFLRNHGRSAKLKNSLPNGILLTGPPGTGKTLLVQAIAGEAQVPIIVESGSLLTDPQQKGRGVERLKKIFDQARQLSPCIIFIDEVDTLGEKRQNIIQTPMGSDELIESIYEKSSNQKENLFIPKPLNLEEDQTGEKDLEFQLFRNESDNSLNTGNDKFQQKAEAKKTRLSLLTQFLVEMDGLKQRQGVIVIGATNRPNVLDPALIRPGRFDQIVTLQLPGKQKRIEILKLYSQKLQVKSNISWDYLANRTKGFSAADIAAAMNESTIQSIIAKTTHTIESIEKGIDIVTSYNSDSIILDSKIKSSDPFFLSRLAYYQAGKAIIPSVLENHPPLVVLHLFPRQKNARHTRLYENSFSEITTKKIMEAQLIGFYAGKASEIMPLYGNKIFNSLKRWHSDLGGEDLLSATFLANLLVDKWYFYSMQILFRKNNQILNTRNDKEFTDLEKFGLSNVLENEIEDELEIEKIAKLSRLGRYQQRGFGPWWQIQVAKQTSEIESFFADWYRIYLPDPEENILNLEWIPPDEYHHSNENLKNLSEKSNIGFNELYQIERDYVFHGLILNAFNTAFDLIEEKREFLDYFSDYLLRFNILRENEIQFILKLDTKGLSSTKKKREKNKNSKLKSYKNLENRWGIHSRRKNSRFLNLETLSFLEKNSTYKSPFLNINKGSN